MNLNEFIALYRRAMDKETPGIAKKLARKMREEIRSMNQPVYIRDLVAKTEPDYSFGEAREHTNYYLEPTVERLKIQIKMLFDLANADHRNYFCEQNADGDFQVKPGLENNVTRLSTPEFAFYTKDAPLSHEAFAELYQNIFENFNLDDNVHVLLSSFAVLDKPGHLLNLCMFVEGGKPLIVHVFCKNFATELDVMYRDTPLFSQQHVLTKNNFNLTTTSVDGIPIEGGRVIYTGSVFEVRTSGGARYTQVIDICADYVRKHGMRQLFLRVLGEACQYDLIPERIEHTVTSNSVSLRYDLLLGDRVLGADPNETMSVFVKDEIPQRLENDVGCVPMEGLEDIKPVSYRTTIMSQKWGYTIEDPPFGSNLMIEAFPPRPAGQIRADIRSDVRHHNYAILAKRLSFLQIDCSSEEHHLSKVLLDNFTDKLHCHLNYLRNVLLQRYELTTMEALYNPEEARIKIMARQIIEEAIDAMINFLKIEGCDAINYIDTWRRNLERSLDSLNLSGCPSPLIMEFKAEIHRIIEIDLGEDLTRDYPQGMSM